MSMTLDVDAILDGLDQMAAARPVAAQVVATCNDENTGAGELAAILGADMALAARVMKLANSAYFGLSGRVRSLQLAVTVVGFNTVRSMATVALSGIDTAKDLPEDFWDTSVHLAAAAGALGPRFRLTTADALCLGLLAQLGAALLHQADPEGYDEVRTTTGLGTERFAAETRRYGLCAPRLTAEALQQWRFPVEMVDTLRAVPSGADGVLLRTAYELAARLLDPGHRRTGLEQVSHRRVTESDAPRVLATIRADVTALQTALGL